MTKRKPPYRLSAPAFRDLQEIEAYIASENSTAAVKVITSIEYACSMLANRPQAGRNRPELHVRLRSFAVGNYVIFYTEENKAIDIIRILHGRRDIETVFAGNN